MADTVLSSFVALLRGNEAMKRSKFTTREGLAMLFGQPRICDLSPNAWEDWKTQRPDLVAELQTTYDCQ